MSYQNRNSPCSVCAMLGRCCALCLSIQQQSSRMSSIPAATKIPNPKRRAEIQAMPEDDEFFSDDPIVNSILDDEFLADNPIVDPESDDEFFADVGDWEFEGAVQPAGVCLNHDCLNNASDKSLFCNDCIEKFNAGFALQNMVAPTHQIPLLNNLKEQQQFFNKWPYNKRTGQKLALDTPLAGDVVSYGWLQKNWPYDKQTGKKLALGTSLGGDVVSYGWLQDNWPYDKQTGKKLALGTSLGGDVVLYRELQSNWPYNKRTGQKLALGTPLGGDVVSYQWLKSNWPCDPVTGERRLIFNDSSEGNLKYYEVQNNWPCNPITGKPRAHFDDKTVGNIPYFQIGNQKARAPTIAGQITDKGALIERIQSMHNCEEKVKLIQGNLKAPVGLAEQKLHNNDYTMSLIVWYILQAYVNKALPIEKRFEPIQRVLSSENSKATEQIFSIEVDKINHDRLIVHAEPPEIAPYNLLTLLGKDKPENFFGFYKKQNLFLDRKIQIESQVKYSLMPFNSEQRNSFFLQRPPVSDLTKKYAHRVEEHGWHLRPHSPGILHEQELPALKEAPYSPPTAGTLFCFRCNIEYRPGALTKRDGQHALTGICPVCDNTSLQWIAGPWVPTGHSPVPHRPSPRTCGPGICPRCKYQNEMIDDMYQRCSCCAHTFAG